MDGQTLTIRVLSGQTQLLWFESSRSSDAYMDGLVQERRNSTVLAMELHLSCINPYMDQ